MEFVNKHGDENFSIFEGVNPMFYRGERDSLYLLGGIIPGQQGEIESWAMTNIYYNINDSTIVKIGRALEGWTDSTYASIDSIYANTLAKRFAELGIYEIWMDSFGTVRIYLDEGSNCLARFENDSIFRESNRVCHWKNISGNWYYFED